MKKKKNCYCVDITPVIMSIVILGTIYGFFSFISFLNGVFDAGWEFTGCHKPKTRIERVFPAYALGCWAGSAPVDNDKN